MASDSGRIDDCHWTRFGRDFEIIRTLAHSNAMGGKGSGRRKGLFAGPKLAHQNGRLNTPSMLWTDGSLTRVGSQMERRRVKFRESPVDPLITATVNRLEHHSIASS